MIIKQQRLSWLILLLALAYLGQSFAVAAMPCHMMGVVPMSHEVNVVAHSVLDTDHKPHEMHQIHIQDKTMQVKVGHDCCATMMYCGAGSCSSTALSYALVFDMQPSSAPKINYHHQRIPLSPLSSFDRPPIFR